MVFYAPKSFFKKEYLISFVAFLARNTNKLCWSLLKTRRVLHLFTRCALFSIAYTSFCTIFQHKDIVCRLNSYLKRAIEICSFL